jgi:transposase
MPVYIGVDFHARTQTVCWCDTADGVIHQRTLDHERDDVRAFYAQFPAPALVGLESSGYALWFHQLLAERNHQVLVGDAFQIRQFARRRQKNDRRDAELLLDLLLRGDFPAVHVPPPASREVLGLLRYRHRLVRMRTMLRNGLQAVALNHQLRLGPRLFRTRGLAQLAALPLQGAAAVQRQHSLDLLDALQKKILEVEEILEARAAADPRVIRLRTHPGVGLLTALAVVHTLEPVTRFDRARRVAAYCGLDPKEHSSGATQRFGHISKQGNRLLRFLLVEAAHRAVQTGQDDDLRRFYFRLLVKKSAAIAAVAVARKLVLRLYRMLREEIDYDEFRRRGRDARRAREYASPARSG